MMAFHHGQGGQEGHSKKVTFEQRPGDEQRKDLETLFQAVGMASQNAPRGDALGVLSTIRGSRVGCSSGVEADCF
jgi:hypothetical protein